MAQESAGNLDSESVFVHGFHNALGRAGDGARIAGEGGVSADDVQECVKECVGDLYPVMCQPWKRVVGDKVDQMAAAYPRAVLTDQRQMYRVFMNVGQKLVWVTLKRDAVVTCAAEAEGCSALSPNAYILRAGYRNTCLGCSKPVIGADVMASVLYAYVLDQLKGGNDFSAVKWPAGFAGEIGGTQMLNVGKRAFNPYADGGFLDGPEVKAEVVGDRIMRSIHLFMPWLHTVGRVVVKSDTQDIIGVARDKIDQYPTKAGSKGADTGVGPWKADDDGFYYSLVMMRVKGPDRDGIRP